jgi:hypothetical protein
MSSENEYTDAEGVRYVAKPSPIFAPQPDSNARKCSGCAHEYLSTACLDAPALCDPMYAGDASRVIWVTADARSRA